MRHLLLDQWSHRSSTIHSADARTKLVLLLLVLLTISLAPGSIPLVIAPILLATIQVSRLPLNALLIRAALVLPFSALLAVAIWFSGDSSGAATLLIKSYLSALAALLFAATTPLPAWTAALRSWHVPATLIAIIQVTYRYLFVIAEEAQTMSAAARARGGFRFSAATGALAVLFARSWQRAESVHRAMLARGYQP
ncbi:MAG: CbiQ family ECF transporter T component [Bryobacteraceae bacterium]